MLEVIQRIYIGTPGMGHALSVQMLVYLHLIQYRHHLKTVQLFILMVVRHLYFLIKWLVIMNIVGILQYPLLY